MSEEAKSDSYDDLLAGTVSLGYLDCTLLEYARGIKYFVEEESRKPNCDTHLINLLRRAACVGWENIHMFKASSTQPYAPADTERLVRLEKMVDYYARRDHAEFHLGRFEDCQRSEMCINAREALED